MAVVPPEGKRMERRDPLTCALSDYYDAARRLGESLIQQPGLANNKQELHLSISLMKRLGSYGTGGYNVFSPEVLKAIEGSSQLTHEVIALLNSPEVEGRAPDFIPPASLGLVERLVKESQLIQRFHSNVEQKHVLVVDLTHALSHISRWLWKFDEAGVHVNADEFFAPLWESRDRQIWNPETPLSEYLSSAKPYLDELRALPVTQRGRNERLDELESKLFVQELLE